MEFGCKRPRWPPTGLDPFFKLCGEEMHLLGRLCAVPFQLNSGQKFACYQCVIHQRHGFVQRTCEGERLVNARAGRVTGLRVTRGNYTMVKDLNHDPVFMARLSFVND